MDDTTTRSHGRSERITFFGIGIACAALILFSLINLRRGCQVYPEFEATMQRYTQLRWLTFFNCLLQLECFIGYYLNNSILTETAWIIWVTTASLCLATLGVRTSQACYDLCQIEEQPHHSRRSTRSRRELMSCCNCFLCCFGSSRRSGRAGRGNNNNNSSKDSSIVCLIYSFWTLSTFFNICGTIAAWKCGNEKTGLRIQFASFGAWRLLYALSLLMTVYRLMRVRRLTITFLNRLEDENYPSMKLETVTASIKLMKTLTCFLILLIAVLFYSAYLDIDEFVRLLIGYKGTFPDVNYTSDSGTQKTSTLQIAGVYFPLWTFVQIVCLAYCWVPQRYLWSAFENLAYSTLNAASSGYF